MGQRKLNISDNNDIGHSDGFPVSTIFPHHILKTNKNRKSISRFFQHMFNKSNVSPTRETATFKIEPPVKSQLNQEAQEKKLLLELENCVDAARIAEGGEQYDWD